MLVRDLMTDNPLAMQLHDSIDLAEKFLRYGRIRHMPVVDEGALVGLITHRDLIRYLAAKGNTPTQSGEEWKRSIPVSSVMQRDVTSVNPDTEIREAIRILLANKYGCLPVTEMNRLVGIITEADFLKFTNQLLNSHPELFRSSSSG